MVYPVTPSALFFLSCEMFYYIFAEESSLRRRLEEKARAKVKEEREEEEHAQHAALKTDMFAEDIENLAVDEQTGRLAGFFGFMLDMWKSTLKNWTLQKLMLNMLCLLVSKVENSRGL